ETPYASLSRAVCGTVGKTLILNLPGSPRGAVTSLQAVLPILRHALDLRARVKHLIHLYKKSSALLLAFFKPLGFWGVGVLAIVDSSSIPMPMDAFIAYYAWHDKHRFYLYVLAAALGSAIGGL